MKCVGDLGFRFIGDCSRVFALPISVQDVDVLYYYYDLTAEFMMQTPVKEVYTLTGVDPITAPEEKK